MIRFYRGDPGFEVSNHQQTTSSSSHEYQDRVLQDLEIQEGGGGSLDAKFGNRIQYAACGVWGVAGADSRAEVHQDPEISRELWCHRSLSREDHCQYLP